MRRETCFHQKISNVDFLYAINIIRKLMNVLQLKSCTY